MPNKSSRVVLNRKNFGQFVMSSTALVRPAAEEVAAQLNNGQIEMIATGSQGGGQRVRARVSHGTSSSEEERTNELASALNSVFGGTVFLQYTTKSGKKRSASQAQINNWTRGSRR
jgi:hypothetical protein